MSEVLASQRRRSWRWIIILAASLLSHLLVFGWAGGYIGMPVPRQTTPPAVSATLIIPPAPAPPARKPETAPKPKPKKKAPPPSPPPDTVTASAAPPVAKPMPELPAGPPANAGETAEAAPQIETGEPEAAETEDAAPRDKFDPPPPAQLDYDVTALRDGQNWYGAGSFRWDVAGGSYSIAGEATVTILFKITVLNFKSEGTINEFGIAPVLYSEKPWRKAITSTHFAHQEGRISFSASNASYPYQGGEQDRASITWQLAAMGRGDPSRFTPGAELEVMVAGARNADRWRIRMIGEEDISTPHGTFQAWHLRREPRAGSRDQTIDFWLAPQLEWYPVRVRYTYANNDYLDMSLSHLTPSASQTTP